MKRAEARMNPRGREENILLVLMGVSAFFFIAFHVSPLWELAYHIWFVGMMAALALVAIINASLIAGYRNALVFLALGVTIGFSVEQFGIATGLIFGPYVYTEKLLPKIVDVPLVIPFCWFAVVYLAHVLANLILTGMPNTSERKLWRLATLSAVTAFVATGFDVAIDPLMSHRKVEAWIWTEGGDYFGVPFRNFQGWVITAFIIDLGYRLFVRSFGAHPIAGNANWAGYWAIGAWAGLAVGFILIATPVETQLIAVFAVFLPALMAAIGVARPRTAAA